jgi:hypothetical protein
MVLLNNTGHDWVILAALRVSRVRESGSAGEWLVLSRCSLRNFITSPQKKQYWYPTLKIPLSTINSLPLKSTKLIVSWNEGKGLEDP